MSNFFWIFLVGVPVLGLLVLVHELGHFLAAKLCGVAVLRFSVGFGPSICRFKRGETVYQLAWIPLGGFVKMAGDFADTFLEGGDEDVAGGSESDAIPRDKWFMEKSICRRAIIVAAGPVFNLLFSLVAIASIFYFYGFYSDDPVVGALLEDSPAGEAGVLPGDRISSIDGSAIASWTELAETVAFSEGKTLSLLVERDSGPVEFSVKPRLAEGGKLYRIGISKKVEKRSIDLLPSIYRASQRTLFEIRTIYGGLWSLVTERDAINNIAGPVFIFQIVSKKAEQGFEQLLRFVAILSLYLAVFNLLPIPVLDGGYLLFFLIEALWGRLSPRAMHYCQSLGMTLLLFLMIFAFVNDCSRDPALLSTP